MEGERKRERRREGKGREEGREGEEEEKEKGTRSLKSQTIDVMNGSEENGYGGKTTDSLAECTSPAMHKRALWPGPGIC